MLTEGTIRLHLKHNGPLSAVLVWMLLLVFNCSRSIFWTLRTFVDSNEYIRSRAQHFRNVVREFNRTWPQVAK
jgi:hypothetical protein